jgi:hypothetical protein
MNFANLVRGTTQTVGTGNITLDAITAPNQNLLAIGLAGTTFPYTVYGTGTEREAGIGTVVSALVFARTTVTESSNANALVNLSAGVKTFTHGLIASQANRFHNSTSVRVVYTSSICVSDADLSIGSTTFGIDQRARLQSILDLALTGPLRVIWDGAYGCSPHPTVNEASLLVRDNTEIQFLPGCGAILRGTAEASLLSNADRNDGRVGNSANGAGNKNITLIGGILNGANVTPSVLQMFGVDGLVLRDMKLLNSASFHGHFGNWKNVALYNVYVDKGPGGHTYNDGLHFCGPGQYLYARDTTILNCGDDNFTLSADDAWVGNTRDYQPRGAITDVVIDGLTMKSGVYGFHILSGGSRVDNISVSRLRGTTSSFYFIINKFDPSLVQVTGSGNIGKVTVDDVAMECIAGVGINAGFVVDCYIEQLTLKNITRSTFLNTAFPSIQFGPSADIKQLKIVDYKSYPFNGGTALAGQINFLNGARVGYASISNSMFNSPATVGGFPITIESGVTIAQLSLLGNVGTNFTDFLSSSGAIGYLHVPATSNFMDTAVASTWVLQSAGHYTEDLSIPGKLTFTGPYTGTVSSAKKASPDAFGGNIQLSCRINMSGTVEPAFTAAIFVRGANSVPLSGISAGTLFSMSLQAGSKGVRLNTIGGADATITTTALGSETNPPNLSGQHRFRPLASFNS